MSLFHNFSENSVVFIMFQSIHQFDLLKKRATFCVYTKSRSVVSFADDTQVYRHINEINDCSLLQNDLTIFSYMGFGQ